MKDLIESWMHYKEVEKEAQESRRFIEDQLRRELMLEDDFKGSKTKKVEGYKINVAVRNEMKVDIKEAQDIASQNELFPYLDSLFRWKAEVKQREWDSCDPRIIELFQEAVTERLGRASFKIEPLEG